MDQGKIPKAKKQSGIFNILKNFLMNTDNSERYPNKNQIFRVLERVKNHGLKYDNLPKEDGFMLDEIICNFLRNENRWNKHIDLKYEETPEIFSIEIVEQYVDFAQQLKPSDYYHAIMYGRRFYSKMEILRFDPGYMILFPDELEQFHDLILQTSDKFLLELDDDIKEYFSECFLDVISVVRNKGKVLHGNIDT